MNVIEMYRGDALRLDVDVTNAETGQPYNLEDASLEFKVYDSPRKETIVIVGDAAVEDEDAGDGIASLDPADTSVFEELRVLYYVVRLVDSQGHPYTLQTGKLIVR